jgi:hypothetical protein
MASYLEDHRRHVRDLSALLRAAGREAPPGPGAGRVLTKGKVVLGGLLGDRSVLAAMKSNEEDTNAAYQRALSRADVPAEVKVALERNLADERRHRDWLLTRLGALGEAAQ